MRVLGLRFPRSRRSPLEHLQSIVISGLLVLFSQFTLAMVPRLFPSFTLVAMLPISGTIIVVTIFLVRCWRRFIGASMSSPAFVLFNILYLWGVYVFKIREAVPSIPDALLNAQCALLLFGLYRILSGDPGTVPQSSSSEDFNFFTEHSVQRLGDQHNSVLHPSSSLAGVGEKIFLPALCYSVHNSSSERAAGKDQDRLRELGFTTGS